MTPDALLLRPAVTEGTQPGRADPGARKSSESDFDKTLARETRESRQAHREERAADTTASAQDKASDAKSDTPSSARGSDARDDDTSAADLSGQTHDNADATVVAAVLEVLPAPGLAGESESRASLFQGGLTGRSGAEPAMVITPNMVPGGATPQGADPGEGAGKGSLPSAGINPLTAAIRAQTDKAATQPEGALNALTLDAADADADAMKQGLLKGHEELFNRPASSSGSFPMTSAPSRTDAAPYVTQLMHPAGSERWQHELGEKMLWMVNQQVHKARIHLNPADLGPIDIQVQVHKDQTQVQVHATQVMTREMLDAAAWRLREALAGQGLNLSGFDVSDQPPWQETPSGESHERGASGQGGELSGEDYIEGGQEIPVRAVPIPGLVDTYA